MEPVGNEEDLLRSVALQNAKGIFLTRERAEHALVQANEALERKTEELAHSLAMMRATLDATTDGIMVAGENGRVSDFNKKFVEMWKLPDEIVAAMDVEKIRAFVSLQIKDPALYVAKIKQVYASSLPESHDLLELLDGRIFERFSRIQRMNGQEVGRVWSFRDITERKQVEEVLRREAQTVAERRQELEQMVNERTASLQEAISQMEEFSYSVSHDLRAPLRAMQAYAAAVLEDYGNKIDEEGQEYLRRIVSAGLRMDRLTQDVLTYSKIPRTAMHLDRVPMNRFMTEIVQQYVRDETCRAQVTVDTPLLDVIGHEPLLAQAVSNLIENAVKFSPPGRSPQIRIRTEPREGRTRLWVEDKGIGIKLEHQGRIWGMFERVHPQHQYKGTGIGLAIVRKAIERMNGTMGVVSDGVTGSQFWLQLPRPEGDNREDKS